MVGGLSLVLLLHVLLRPPAAAQYRQDNDRKQEETPRGRCTLIKRTIFLTNHRTDRSKEPIISTVVISFTRL